jgi:hypothetical protein
MVERSTSKSARREGLSKCHSYRERSTAETNTQDCIGRIWALPNDRKNKIQTPDIAKNCHTRLATPGCNNRPSGTVRHRMLRQVHHMFHGSFRISYVQDVRAPENQTNTRHSSLRADAASAIIVPPFATGSLAMPREERCQLRVEPQQKQNRPRHKPEVIPAFH